MTPMIEIDTREFRESRDLLAKLLRERYNGPVQVQRTVIRIGDIERPKTSLTLQEARDLVKRALHHMRLDEYRVVTHAGVVAIRERRLHEPHLRRKGSVPSVKQSVPYFFPG